MASDSVNLYPVTNGASSWRDLGVKSRRQELLVKIALVAGIILLLAGMAVSFYFCATTTQTVTSFTGQVYQWSNAGFCAIPAIFGTVTVFAMVGGFFCCNFERNGSE